MRALRAALGFLVCVGCSDAGAAADGAASGGSGATGGANAGAGGASAGAGGGGCPLVPTHTPRSVAHDVVALFTHNVHDFAYPELSRAVMKKVITLHEELGIPVDIYLTTWMTDEFEKDDPTTPAYDPLLGRLFTSPMVNVNYHVRPPSPYYTPEYDWSGLAGKSRDEIYATALSYEQHGLDLVTGLSTAELGGYAKLKELYCRAPLAVGTNAGVPFTEPVNQVFFELGATFTVLHNQTANFGEPSYDLQQRPEHYDLKLGTHRGEAAKDVVDAARAAACADPAATHPCVVGIKMHDNDFYATGAAWSLVYAAGTQPPFDVTQKPPLQSANAQSATWKLYEDTVRYVASIPEQLPAVSVSDFAAASP